MRDGLAKAGVAPRVANGDHATHGHEADDEPLHGPNGLNCGPRRGDLPSLDADDMQGRHALRTERTISPQAAARLLP